MPEPDPDENSENDVFRWQQHLCYVPFVSIEKTSREEAPKQLIFSFSQ
jgi:hypothetical protein